MEPLAHRRELAREVGADVVIEPGEAIEEILNATRQRGVDCAIDCAAKEDTTGQGVQITRNAGRVALTGIHSPPLVSLDGSAMRRKELTIFNVRRLNHETKEALELLHAHGEFFRLENGCACGGSNRVDFWPQSRGVQIGFNNVGAKSVRALSVDERNHASSEPGPGLT